MIFRSVLTWLALLLIASTPSVAQAAPRAIAPATLARIHTISVVSAIGDRATIKRIGVTAFGNQESQLPIEEWGLDALAEHCAMDALGARFSVTSVAADRAAFTPVMRHGGLVGFGAGPDVAGIVRRLPATGVDAYLILVKRPYTLATTSQQVEGVGIYLHRGPLGQTRKPTVFAAYDLALVRAGTGEVLAQRLAQGPSPYYPTAAAPFALAIGAPEDWADTADQFSAAQKDKLRSALSGVLNDSIRLTLAKMGLIGAGAG